jgi:hypothetical protein
MKELPTLDVFMLGPWEQMLQCKLHLFRRVHDTHHVLGVTEDSSLWRKLCEHNFYMYTVSIHFIHVIFGKFCTTSVGMSLLVLITVFLLHFFNCLYCSCKQYPQENPIMQKYMVYDLQNMVVRISHIQNVQKII